MANPVLTLGNEGILTIHKRELAPGTETGKIDPSTTENHLVGSQPTEYNFKAGENLEGTE